jgi:hypothetical protein
MLFGWHGKLGVELCNVALTQKLIGFLHAADASQPQFLRQAPLPGPKGALTAPARLR